MEDSDLSIQVKDLSKKFTRSIKRSMFYGTTDIFRNMLGIEYSTEILRKGEFWSLQDISFNVKKGETIGIIGKNGSGKSTLLRLLNGIYPPDKGEITVKGKIGALIAVGAGFHPHMSGRENIYLNGTILGMSRKEIDSKIQTIIKFADIGDFLDAPVSTYSSGMSVRLGFSIAIHSEPEILLADEVLAVGDLTFALKCYRKISEFQRNGGTVVLVSHNMQLIRNTCSRAIWINEGKIIEIGDTQKVCDSYESYMFKKDQENAVEYGSIINNDPDAKISNVKFFNIEGKETKEFQKGEELFVRIYFDTTREIIEPIFTFSILNIENINLLSNYTNFDNVKLPKKLIGKGYVEVHIPNLIIKPGNYNVTVTLSEKTINDILDWHEKQYSFTVVSDNKVAYGLLQIPVNWKFNLDNEPSIDKYISEEKKIDNVVKMIFGNRVVKTIFDIGACEGEDSIKYALYYPNAQIYSFEPLPKNIEKVKTNIRKYNINNISVVDMALSDKTGTTNFYVSSGQPENASTSGNWDFGNKSSSLLKPHKATEYNPWLKFDETIVVQTETLNNFCLEKDITKIDFVHLDVQGAEILILSQAKNMLKRIGVIMLEVSKDSLYKDQPLSHEVEIYLNKNGFEKVYEEYEGISGDQVYTNKEFFL